VAFEEGEAPNPSEVHIESIAYQGSGCRQGSAVYNLSPDREAMTLLFDSYIVNSADVAGKLAEKSCRVTVKIRTPPTWSFSVFGADYRGFAVLNPGVTGHQGSRYSFAGEMTKLPPVALAGPFNEDYQQGAEVELQRPSYSPCHATTHTLTLESSIRVEGREPFRNGNAPAQGSMTVDSADGQLEEDYGLLWKPCTGPAVQVRCPVIGEAPNGKRRAFISAAWGPNEYRARLHALEKSRQRCHKVRDRRNGRYSCRAYPVRCRVVQE
jgi:hypothetical protein